MADLIYEVKDHLARITMNRPEHLNCFSEEMIRLWTAALEDIRDRADIYAVLLSGNGKAFCAGGDVKAMAAGDGFFESHDDITSTALARKNSLWREFSVFRSFWRKLISRGLQRYMELPAAPDWIWR